MSTKCTLAYGDEFHFYQEALDDDHVYLEMRSTQFEAGYGRVMVPIPVHIWETIRHLGAPRLDLVDLSDQELLKRVEAKVDQRIAEYLAAERERPGGNGLMRLFGSLIYGAADRPREGQIADGMQYFIRERARQRKVQAAILALRISHSCELPRSSEAGI